MQEALNPGTGVSCLALLYPSSLHKSQTLLTSETGDQERKGIRGSLHTQAYTQRAIPQEMVSKASPCPQNEFTLKQEADSENDSQSEHHLLLLPPRAGLPAPSGLGSLPSCTYQKQHKEAASATAHSSSIRS